MNPKAIGDFLQSIFGEIPEDAFWYTWTFPEKSSQWRRGPGAIKAATEYLVTQPKKDLYYSLAVSSRDRGPGKRHTMDQSTGIMCLWADIDIAHDVHQKTNLPKTVEEAKRLLDFIPAPPTWTIHSGHGLQVLWCFNEPWIFESEDERKEAQDLAVGWIYMIRDRFRRENYDVDATIDLSRVFRIPGTINNKDTNNPVPVTVLEHDETARYERDQLSQYISEKVWEEVRQKGAPTLNGVKGSYVINANAVPPSPHFANLKLASDDFKNVVEGTVKPGDGSQSSIDQSVANFCVMAGWSDQWIVDLMIYLRRVAGKQPKLRKDYFDSTINLARSAYDEEGERQQQVEAANTLKAFANEETLDSIEEKRRRAFVAFMKMIGVEMTLKRFVKYKSDPPQYDLVFANNETVHLENPSELGNIRTFRDRIMGVTNRTFSLDLFQGKKKIMPWEEAIQSLLDVREDEVLDEASTREGQLKVWLREYLENNVPEVPGDIVPKGIPLLIHEKVRIKWSSFWQWVVVRHSAAAKTMPESSRKATLRVIGGRECPPYPIVVQGINGKRKTSVRMWELPGRWDEWTGGADVARVEIVRSSGDRENDKANKGDRASRTA